MRKFAIIFILLLIISGCSNKPSLELVSSSVEISDKNSVGISSTSGEKKGEIIKPISLSYQFVIKNNGKKTLGETEKFNNETFQYDDGIKFYIEPNKKLLEVTESIMGVNIFDKEKMQQTELGTVRSGPAILESNQEGKYSIDFELGALEENSEIRVAPSPEQLVKLEKSSLNATLIISIEDKEIGRFDLKNSNK